MTGVVCVDPSTLLKLRDMGLYGNAVRQIVERYTPIAEDQGEF
jgi:hypothetical protein